MFRRLAVVGVVALAATSAASARELTGKKDGGEAAVLAFDDSESGKPAKAVDVLKSVVKSEGEVMTKAKAEEEKLKQKKWTQKVIKPLKKLPHPKKPAAKSKWDDKKGHGEAGEAGEAVSKKEAKQIEKDAKPGPKTKAAKKKYQCKAAKKAALDAKKGKGGEAGESGEAADGDFNKLCKPKKDKIKPAKVKKVEVVKYKIDKEDKDAKKAAKKGGDDEAGEASEAGYAVGKKSLADKVHVVKGKTPAVAPKPSNKKTDGKGSTAWNNAHPPVPKEQKEKKGKKDHGEATAEAEIKVKSKPVKEKASKHADEAGESVKGKGKH